jgi:hypothetical protein
MDVVNHLKMMAESGDYTGDDLNAILGGIEMIQKLTSKAVQLEGIKSIARTHKEVKSFYVSPFHKSLIDFILEE